MTLLIFLAHIFCIPLFSPLCIGVIRKLKARLQNRHGASVLQPYRDIWKLFHKDEVISNDASWIFRYAPFIVFASTIAASASIPIFSSASAFMHLGDMLSVIYILAIGTFFLALAGMDTGSAFGGFGSSREVTVSALAEGGFIFSLLTVALVTKTTNLSVMAQVGFSAESFLPIILSFMGFFIVLMAETARYPFDNPATHLELTMIHEAMILEYSGKRLALMEWAAANKLLLFAVIGMTLFFPWGIPQTFDSSAIALGACVLALKVFCVLGCVGIIESTIAKLRYFRLPDVLIVAFILNCIAIGLVSH